MSHRHCSRLIGLGSLALLAASGLVALGAGPASAATATRYVATTGDDQGGSNACTASAHPCRTIQQALDESSDGDTVQVGAGTYDENVHVYKSVTLAGATSGTTTITGGAGDASVTVGTEAPVTATLTHLDISGNKAQYGLAVGPGATVTLSASTVSRNAIAGAIVAGQGALTVRDSHLDANVGTGVLNTGGTLELTDSTASDNTATPGGGGPDFAFGVGQFAGSTTIERSTLAGNGLAGVYVVGGGLAAAVPAAAPASDIGIGHSTISGNGAIGIANGPGGVVTVDDSTISGNHGAGVYAEQSSTTVSSSTVADTSAYPDQVQLPSADLSGGLVYIASPQAAARRAGTGVFALPSRKVDVAGRSLRLAPAAARPQASSALGISVTASVLDQQAGTADCNGTVTDGGYNLSSDPKNSCSFTSAQHSLTRTDPKLTPLADNGGPTRTQLVAKGSAAIDAIPTGSAGCSAKADDQRGVGRPQGGRCDIGAVEARQSPVLITPASLPHGTVGEAYRQRLSATGGLGAPYEWSLAPGSSLPGGLTLSAAGVLSGTPTKAGRFPVTVSVDDPTLKTYTLVIDAPAAPNGGSDTPVSSAGTEPIANTGAPTGQLTTTGVLAVLAGLAVLLAAGAVGRRPGRHRARPRTH